MLSYLPLVSLGSRTPTGYSSSTIITKALRNHILSFSFFPWHFHDRHSRPTQVLNGRICHRQFSSSYTTANEGYHAGIAAIREIQSVPVRLVDPYETPQPHGNRRRLKHCTTSQNAGLEQALRQVVPGLYFLDLPTGSRKFNLSYVNPRVSWDRIKYRRAISKRTQHSDPARQSSVRAILERCILRKSDASQFSLADSLELGRTRYSEEDVLDWSRVLVTPSSESAVKLLSELSNPPDFLVLLVLRRKYFSGRALISLMDYISKRFQFVEPTSIHVSRTSGRSNPLFDDGRTFFLLLVRLLRVARQEHPESFTDIISLAVRGLKRIYRSSDKTYRETAQRKMRSWLTLDTNRLLVLLALPPNVHPKSSARVQENAQFDLIRFMNDQMPPVIITLPGYRALITVQLANKKTPEERVWANLKSKSWPPWKEDKTGLDAAILPEHGISRAGRILQSMVEAGYSAKVWEDVAKIYSGWDVDRSPTIQTRVTIGKVPGGSSTLDIGRHSDINQTKPYSLWAARIRSTRTMREAWAAFLAYEKEYPRSTNAYAHQAMCEQMIAAHERPFLNHSILTADSTLPGDGKELFPEPESSYEQTYVERMPPSLEVFVNDFLDRGVRPRGRFLSLLLAHINDVNIGMRLLDIAGHGEDFTEFTALMRGHDVALDPSRMRMMQDIPSHLFSSYIAFISNNMTLSISKWELVERALVEGDPKGSYYTHSAASDRLRWNHPLLLVLEILCTKKPRYRMPYIIFIQQFMQGPIPSLLYEEEHRSADNLIMVFRLLQISVKLMQSVDVEMDEATFHAMCKIMSKVARSNQSRIAIRSELFPEWSAYIRSLFGRIVVTVRSQSGTARNAKLLFTPRPETLHAYVRALGFLRDYEGLYSIVCFLCDFESELLRQASSVPSGKRHLPLILTSMRAALEGEQRTERVSVEESATELIQALVKEKAKTLSAEWGGWPSNEDVALYREKGAQDRQRDL